MSITDRRGFPVDGANPTGATDVPSSQIAIKMACRVATTANITLGGLQTIDGVTLVDGNRVLVKNQSTASENGIYRASSGNWTRTVDWDGTYEIGQGTIVLVTAGTTQALKTFYISSANPLTIGTSNVTISELAPGPELAAIAALTGTGILRRTGTATWTLGTTITVAEGGTGIVSYTIGDLVYASGTTTLSKLADIATGNALLSGGVGAAPAWGKVGLTTHISGVLPVANGGTNASSASGTALDNITGFASTGILTRTASGTYAFRTVTGTSAEITVANGDGVSGNPTLSLPSALTFTGKTVTGGTFASPAAITGLPDPSSAQDAATKAYVDSVAAGLDVKPSVKCATTADITLSGEQTIDGVLTSASRVLVKNQSAPAQNGIYVSAAGAWARATDMNHWDEVPGSFVFVEEGTSYADCAFVCTANSGGTIGSTSVAWSQFAGAGTYTATGGVTLTGTQFSITTNGISDAMLRQGAALSLIGRSANSTGNVADIAAGSDHQVLRRSGTSIGFGAVDLSQSAAVTGDLPLANLAQGSALSVLGVAGGSTADNASISAGSDHQVLRRSGSTVAFGAVDLSQAAAVTGTLPVANGGTGDTGTAWSSYTPTATPSGGAFDPGGAVTSGATKTIGKTVHFRISVSLVHANKGTATGSLDLSIPHTFAANFSFNCAETAELGINFYAVGNSATSTITVLSHTGGSPLTSSVNRTIIISGTYEST